MNQNVLLRAATLLLPVVLAGCHTMLVPEEIPPRAAASTATRVALLNVNHGVCDFPVQLDRSIPSGDAIPRPGTLEAISGFNNFVLRGADPFPCNRQRSQVYRGVVHFDVADLRNTIIDSATLRVEMRNGLPWRLDGSSSQCHLAVARATEDWVAGYRSGPAGTTVAAVPFRRRELGNTIVGSIGFDSGVRVVEREVGPIVQDWVLGRPNFGFVLHQEEPNGSLDGANDRSCTTVFSNMTLRLSIRRFVRTLEP